MSTVGADSKVGPPSPLAPVLPFVDAGDADPNVELHGLMVLRHGYVVAEGAGGPPHTAERTPLLCSLSHVARYAAGRRQAEEAEPPAVEAAHSRAGAPRRRPPPDARAGSWA